MTSFYIVAVADPRFSGGSSAALAADVRAFVSLGARVGLLPVTSRFFGGVSDAPNREVTALLDLEGVDAVASGRSVRSGTAFFHHPLVFFHGVAERCEVRAERAVLVVHQAPFRGDGLLEYDPLADYGADQACFWSGSHLGAAIRRDPLTAQELRDPYPPDERGLDQHFRPGKLANRAPRLFRTRSDCRVVEAKLMERPCVLDSRLEPTFGAIRPQSRARGLSAGGRAPAQRLLEPLPPRSGH